MPDDDEEVDALKALSALDDGVMELVLRQQQRLMNVIRGQQERIKRLEDSISVSSDV